MNEIQRIDGIITSNIEFQALLLMHHNLHCRQIPSNEWNTAYRRSRQLLALLELLLTSGASGIVTTQNTCNEPQRQEFLYSSSILDHTLQRRPTSPNHDKHHANWLNWKIKHNSNGHGDGKGMEIFHGISKIVTLRKSTIYMNWHDQN